MAHLLYTVSALYRCRFGDSAVACTVLLHAGTAEGKKSVTVCLCGSPLSPAQSEGHRDAADVAQWVKTKKCSDAFEVHARQQSSCHCVARNSPPQSAFQTEGEGAHNNTSEMQRHLLLTCLMSLCNRATDLIVLVD